MHSIILPGDPPLVALWKSNHRVVCGTCLGVFYYVSGSRCHKVKVQLRVVLLERDTAIRIDQLPCRGAPHNTTRSIPFGRTHFPGSCPASEDQHVIAYLGTTERLARRYESYGAGVWAHRPLHTCTLRGRPEAELAPLIQEQAYIPIRRALLSR